MQHSCVVNPLIFLVTLAAATTYVSTPSGVYQCPKDNVVAVYTDDDGAAYVQYRDGHNEPCKLKDTK